MSELRSAIEQLRGEGLTRVPDVVAEKDFAELQQAAQSLETERLRRLADLDRRGLHRRDGHLSTVSWLAHGFRVGWGAAHQQVRMARNLSRMPETRRALDDGDLSLSAARVLVAAREVDPVAFDRCERTLVDAARIHSVRDLQRVTAHWRRLAERERSTDEDDQLRARRRLHASRTLGAWCEWTATSIPKPGRRCSPRSPPSWMPRRGPAPKRPARRGSVAPTRSARSAGSGWTALIGPSSGASGPT
jgi:hypothetical protein